jgi:hypothetical protein
MPRALVLGGPATQLRLGLILVRPGGRSASGHEIAETVAAVWD